MAKKTGFTIKYQLRLPFSLFELKAFSFSWSFVQSLEASLETPESGSPLELPSADLTDFRLRLTHSAALAHRFFTPLFGGGFRIDSLLVDSANRWWCLVRVVAVGWWLTIQKSYWKPSGSLKSHQWQWRHDDDVIKTNTSFNAEPAVHIFWNKILSFESHNDLPYSFCRAEARSRKFKSLLTKFSYHSYPDFERSILIIVSVFYHWCKFSYLNQGNGNSYWLKSPGLKSYSLKNQYDSISSVSRENVKRLESRMGITTPMNHRKFLNLKKDWLKCSKGTHSSCAIMMSLNATRSLGRINFHLTPKLPLG